MSEIMQSPEAYSNPDVRFKTILSEVSTGLLPEVEINGEEFGLKTVIDLSDQVLAPIHDAVDYVGDYNEEFGAYLGIYVPLRFCCYSGYRYVKAERLVFVPAHRETYGGGFGPYTTVEVPGAFQSSKDFSDSLVKYLVETNRVIDSVPPTGH